MYWHHHFQSVFFQYWQKRGLPYHEKYVKQWIELRSKIHLPDHWLSGSNCDVPALEKSLLDAVYGFGVLIGKLLANLLSLQGEEVHKSAEWCGRFNLAISLLDYIFDEEGDMAHVISLPVFNRFTQGKNVNARPHTAVEQLLCDLAMSVMDDIYKLRSARKTPTDSRLTMSMLKKMFSAETLVANTPLSAGFDIYQMKKALKEKSAFPFKLMAIVVAQMANITDPQKLNYSMGLGESLGNVYWLIDDAKDVWEDFNVGQCNLFLLLAVKENPDLLQQTRNAFTDNWLVKFWQQEKHAEKMAKRFINRLAKSANASYCSKEEKEQTLGLIAASLWQWYKN
jgi:hypothetical protein